MKEPNAAGTFYPARPQELSGMIDAFLQKVPAGKKVKPWAIIVPHAGYIFSGQTAAYAYKLLEKQQYKSVIILAPSHYFSFNGAAVYPGDSFKTPLGVIPVATDLVARLTKNSIVAGNEDVFEQEHALEVQLPFLQTVLGDFKLVPVLIGQYSKETLVQIKDALLPLVKNKDVLVVVSTDLAHFKPAELNDQQDAQALALLKANDLDGLLTSASYGECELCGLGPVGVAMLLAKELDSGFQLLQHTNSAAASGDYDHVVGYASGYYS
jgi:AmmeMemoRadiSam system protein B